MVKRKGSTLEQNNKKHARDNLDKKAVIDAIVNNQMEEKDELDSDEQSSGDEQEPEQAHSTGKRAQISAQDIQIAQETAELFQSNIFKLQIDELISHVTLKTQHILRVEKFLHKLYDTLQRVPVCENKSVEEVDLDVKIPFPDPKPQNVNYKFGYLKPDVTLVGSFGLKTGIVQPQGSTVDVLLTMPEELFTAKDYLNYRAVHKRAFYVGYLAHHLEKLLQDDFIQIEYKHLNGDVLNPVIRITCTHATDNDFNFFKTKFAVNLVVGFPQVFDNKKLLPNKNCIRIADVEVMPPTPYYNHSILSSMYMEHYLKFLYKTKKATEHFKESIVLGRLWLSQRGFDSKVGSGFGHFEFAALVGALLQGGGVQGNKVLLHGYSSYQIFKSVMKFLAEMDLSSGYLEFHSDMAHSSSYVEDGFNTPTIFDKTTKINILSKMTGSSYQLLRKYAQQTLENLGDVSDKFDAIFLTKLSPLLKYDTLYEISLPHDAVNMNPLEKVQFISVENFIVNKLSNIVKISLGDRIVGCSIDLASELRFPTSKRRPAQHTSFVRVRILVNPAEVDKLITKGPLNTEPSEEFIAFWGEKASLRRFKDGTIRHCVLWSGNDIVTSVLQYAFNRHVGEGVAIKRANNVLGQLPLPNLPGSKVASTLSLASYHQLKKSFDNLYRELFSMSLPLSIKSVLPVGPNFRYTSTLQPVPFAMGNADFYNDVILEFETSQRWPDELASLEKAKVAFLLKIQSMLSCKSFMVRDDSIPFNQEIITLNVLTPEGYGFRLRVLTERDELMYLRALSNTNVKQPVEDAYFKFNQKYLSSVKHTRMVEGLVHKHPIYSPTVRLFKKWLDSHLLLSHLPEELVELIALKPFVDSAPYFAPGSLENGFFQVLKFISQWNWKEDPLILQHDMSLALYKQIQSTFTETKRQGNETFFVGTKNDPSGVLYSHGVPIALATRLTALSKIAITLIKQHGLNEETMALLFTPGLNDYNFHFKLRVPELNNGILAKFKNLAVEQDFPKDITSQQDPVQQFVKYLNMKYFNTVLFFSRKFTIDGENVVCGLFKPSAGQMKFKVNADMNSAPVESDEIALNKDAILNEIAAFGKSLMS